MKQSRLAIKALSVLLAFCFFAGSGCIPYSKSLGDSSRAYALSLEEQQAQLEQKLKEINSKLDSLGKQSRETEEYISVLNERIDYLKKELSLSQKKIDSSQNEIKNLKQQHEENEKAIQTLQLQIDAMSKEGERLEKEFNASYAEYGERAKALYISGNTSVLELILTSNDISTLLTRLEMIKRVSVSDKELLEQLMTQGDEIRAIKTDMEQKSASLANTQKTLEQNEASLKNSIKTLEIQQSDYKDKQSLYESEKSESDRLLQNLHHQTQTYSEYRNADLEDLAAINAEIEAAAEKYKQELEQSTTTTTQPPTTKPPQSSNDNDNDTDNDTTQPTKPSTTQPSSSSSKLSMTYPVPSQTKITTAYGSAGYAGHTGVDFACSSGAKVVAAESGIVIISKDITYHSPCSCSNTGGGYHSYGRYIVIMHDKKNSSGNYVYTLYAHNSSRVVSEGQRVSKGQLIAYAGSTGNSTGPHCHFEVRTPDALYEHCVNPAPYLP